MPTKINLSLLKKFLSELETNLTVADTIRDSEGDPKEYLVEMAKASGLATSVMQEAQLIVGDIKTQMMKVQSPNPVDYLAKFLEGKGDPLGDPFGPGGNGTPGTGGAGGGNAN
jgi:hypothetical protein